MTLADALDRALDPATHASNVAPLRQIAAQHEPEDARRLAARADERVAS